MEKIITLDDINPGEKAYIKELKAKDGMRRRLLDIGLVRGTIAECIGKSPLGDPKAFYIRGAVIALRSEDLKEIIVVPVTEAQNEE